MHPEQRFNVSHWMGHHKKIPGVIVVDGDTVDDRRYFVDIPIDQIGQKLMEFSKEFDIMLLDSRDGGYPTIQFDTKCRCFRQR